MSRVGAEGVVGRRLVIGDLRVQEIKHGDGRRSWTIVWPEGREHAEADRFLRRHEGSGTQRTYAYLLVDHLRWLERECLGLDVVALRDLERYMGVLGADVRTPFGEPWRIGKRPYGQAALEATAACLKGFYLHQAAFGVNGTLAAELNLKRVPSKADRRRAFLGHAKTQMSANPLAPERRNRRHPKMLPEGSRTGLEQAVGTSRDRMVVTWLSDAGMRIGELCGLHLVDLHLRGDAACGECQPPHVHICHRPTNANQAAAKSKPEWRMEGGVVRGGLIRRASPAMIHTYFEYMTSEYPHDAAHGMLLVQLQGARAGQPWAASAARGMLRRAGARAGLGLVKPHAFRHTFATAVLDASDGNLLIARDAGGWASATTVDEVYGHVDRQDTVFGAALEQTWGEPR